MASSISLESSILSNNSSSPTTNFSRRSATYTASTFAAFEYGSNYEYHGSYNIKAAEDGEKNDPENDQEFSSSTRIGFDDFDELLEGLNEQELKELSIIDPDVMYSKCLKNMIFFRGFKRKLVIFCKTELFKHSLC